MKYYKTLNQYKASNLIIDMNSMAAYSYAWWKFVAKIDGKIVFNDYGYSPSTRLHQAKIRELLGQLGIGIDLFIAAPEGLQSLDSAVPYYEYEIQKLKDVIAKKGTRKAKNEERMGEIRYYERKIQEVKDLLKKD